jgi:hypothetical protein
MVPAIGNARPFRTKKGHSSVSRLQSWAIAISTSASTESISSITARGMGLLFNWGFFALDENWNGFFFNQFTLAYQFFFGFICLGIIGLVSIIVFINGFSILFSQNHHFFICGSVVGVGCVWFLFRFLAFGKWVLYYVRFYFYVCMVWHSKRLVDFKFDRVK